MQTNACEKSPAQMPASVDTSHRYLLFGIRSRDALQQKLEWLAARREVSFGTPQLLDARRALGPSPQPASLPRTGRSPALGRPAPSDPGRDAAVRTATPGGTAPVTAPVVPVWLWSGSAADLRAHAQEVLNGFVYPLAAGERPYCVAFPFGREELSPRPLEVEQRRLLDLEDIAALLSAEASPPLAPPTVAAAMLEGLDPDQYAAAVHTGGPARVLAAAGSGKTKTMVARIAALVARGVSPQSILVLAFNAEAALQLEERLAAVGVPTTRRVQADAEGVHCATFNAFGYRFQQGVLGGVPAVSADGAAQERLLRRALARGGDPGGSLTAPAAWDPYNAVLTDRVATLAGALDSWHAELRPPDSVHRPAVERYERLQAAQGVQTFDDQVIATVCALLAHPQHRRLLQSIYRYVLVDEFQDVNPAQQALLDILSRPWRNLFVVGDDDQLIYGWRSAHVGSIVDFGAGLPPAPYTAYYTLPTNYRCSQQVVARAEQLVVNNERRAGKSMRPRSAAPAGAVLFATATTTDERCREIAAFLSVEHVRLGCRWSDLAVLARYRAQLDMLRPGLERYAVPLGEPKAAVNLDAAGAVELDRRLQAALQDRRLRDLPATALLEEVAGAPGMDHDAALGVLDAARLLACDHATPAALAAAWRRLARACSPAAPGPAPQPPDGVTMATIHSTKGREYASVVIVDFAPALKPLSQDELEEERRVLYVALTRAKHAALLTVNPTRARRPPGGNGSTERETGLGHAGGAAACHPFMHELARPPQRGETRSLRRDLAGHRAQLEGHAGDLPPALVALLSGAAAPAERPPGPQPGGGSPSSESGPVEPDLAEAAARYLHVRSRLAEARLFAPPSAIARLLRSIR